MYLKNIKHQHNNLHYFEVLKLLWMSRQKVFTEKKTIPKEIHDVSDMCEILLVLLLMSSIYSRIGSITYI